MLCSRCCVVDYVFFFFKQKTAYEMRISDWSSDVCSSDLGERIQAMTPRMSDSFMINGSSPSTLTSVPDHLPNRMRSPALTSSGVTLPSSALAPEIGRASCRERVCKYV